MRPSCVSQPQSVPFVAALIADARAEIAAAWQALPSSDRSSKSRPDRRCLVRFAGRQQGCGGVPSFDLYNIIAGEDVTIGSTVTLNSLRAKGFTVEVVS